MAIADTSVKFYLSGHTGLGAIGNSAGTGITFLDKVLVNGFNSVSVSTLVVADNVATVTTSTAHNMGLDSNVGKVITIEGATPSALNREWRIATVPNTTSFTFVTADISNQTATGTITAKRSPLGFEKVWSGTNKAVYRTLSLDGTRLYLRVDDSSTTAAVIKGYLAMTDIDTGTEPIPTTTTYWYKSNQTSSAQICVGDSRAFYILSQTNSNGNWGGGMYFGDFASPFSDADAFCAGLLGGSATSGADILTSTASSVGTYSGIVRSYTQLPNTQSTLYRYFINSIMDSITYPCPVNNGMFFTPIIISQGVSFPRGLLPGYYKSFSTSNANNIPNVFVQNVSGIDNRTIYYAGDVVSGCGFDITGPWR